MLRRFNGAVVRRVIDRSYACIPEHAHGWPLLSIFVMGGYSSRTELGETAVAGPSATFYRAGAVHRNIIGPAGFEQIEIEFDPAWLGNARIPDVPVTQWLGGRAGADARVLARLCALGTSEDRLRVALRVFVERASTETQNARSGWVCAIIDRLRHNPALKISELAEDLGRHPSWLGTAYRRATGEGIQETAARLRVERAAQLLRETDVSYTSIAADAGFCDQSHMIRTVRRVLGRLPSDVRKDRQKFRGGRM